jgi:hypothetical protein
MGKRKSYLTVQSWSSISKILEVHRIFKFCMKVGKLILQSMSVKRARLVICENIIIEIFINKFNKSIIYELYNFSQKLKLNLK